MRQGRIATLALPFPAADREQVLAMRAGRLQSDRRHERSGVMLAWREPTTLECAFEEGRLFVRGDAAGEASS